MMLSRHYSGRKIKIIFIKLKKISTNKNLKDMEKNSLSKLQIKIIMPLFLRKQPINV